MTKDNRLLNRELFDSIVHGLRSQGWSRFDAEGEALNRIERARASSPEQSNAD